MSFAIHVQPGSLARTATGGVTGTFWLEVGGVAFPAEGWGDFVEPALLPGLRELFGIQSRVPGTARIRFMDGPYRADFRYAGGAEVEVRLAEVGGGTRVLAIAVDDVGPALHDAFATLAAGYAMRGWDANELTRYAALIGA